MRVFAKLWRTETAKARHIFLSQYLIEARPHHKIPVPPPEATRTGNPNAAEPTNPVPMPRLTWHPHVIAAYHGRLVSSSSLRIQVRIGTSCLETSSDACLVLLKHLGQRLVVGCRNQCASTCSPSSRSFCSFGSSRSFRARLGLGHRLRE